MTPVATVVKRRLSNSDGTLIIGTFVASSPRPRFGGPSMRLRLFVVCAALAGFALANTFSSTANAADAKAKAKKKDDSSEDKTGIGKTLQWEDKVMGPDDKKSELDKIRKAQEINKACLLYTSDAADER